MTDDVAALVLKDNYEQTETLSLAEAQAREHARRARRASSAASSSAGKLDRELEALPSDEAIAERKREHGGLTRPELAVAARVQQDRPLRGAARLGRARGPVPVGRARALLPVARCPSASASRCARTGCGARSSRRRWSTTCSTAAGTHVRLPAARGDRRAGLGHRARLRGARARSSRCARSGPRSRRSTTGRGRHVQITMLLEGRRLVERGARWLLAQPPPAARHRSDRAATSRPGAMVLYDVDPAAARAVGRRAAGAAGRRAARAPGCRRGLAARVAGLPLDVLDASTSSRWPAETRARRGARSPRVALPARQPARSCTGCATRSWPCRATTAGARCARAALRDDLYSIHRELTAEVLRDRRRRTRTSTAAWTPG